MLRISTNYKGANHVFFTVLAVLNWCAVSFAITDLAPGDVAIIGFNADGGDDFSFVTLVDVDGGTEWEFTDGEGIITYTAPGDGLPFGSVVVVTNASLTSISVSTGSVARTGGSYNFSANGDELEVYQGTNYAYVGETRITYAPPPGSGLTAEESTWVSHVNAIDNGRYTGPRIGSRGQLLRAIADLDNWSYTDGSGDQSLDLDTEPYNTPFSPIPAVFLTTVNVRVAEDYGTAKVGIALDRTPATNAIVRFNTVFDSAVPGMDYVHTNGIITWVAGERSTQNVEITVLDNVNVDGPRSFCLFIYQPELCQVEGPALAALTILDDDAASPVVSNGAASGVAARSAMLSGSVAPLDAFAEATIFWGPADGGTNATAWSNSLALGIVEGVFGVEATGLAPGTNYYYRCAASNLAGMAWAPTTASFTTLSAQNYYVNDDGLTDDVYCSATGSDTINNGKSPDAPKASLQAILTAYDLGPGDIVFIDTGVYNLASTITINGSDTGSAGNPVFLRGSVASAGSLFNRNNASADVLHVDAAGDCYLRIENLHLTGGKRGIYGHGTDENYCIGLEIVNCESYGNDNWFSEAGIYLQYCVDASIEGCESYSNNYSAGVSLHNCDSCLVVSNHCYRNGGLSGIELKNGISNAVRESIVHDHTAGYGISVSWEGNGAFIGNTCHNNAFYGLDLHNCTGSQVADNTSYSNSSHGIRIEWDGVADPSTAAGPKISGNRVFANGGNGIENTALGTGHLTVNNTVYSNAGYNIRFGGSGVDVVFENNTLYGGDGVYFEKPGAGTHRHNILWATGTGNAGLWVQNMPDDPAAFVSDYNNMYATDGADVARWPLPDGNPAPTLGDWISDAWKDWNSISADPLFVDTENGDFHVQSTGGSYHEGLWHGDEANSPCLDAGDPAADFEGEPHFSGLRVNLGADGNTAEASRTLETGPFHLLALTAVPEGTGTTDAWPPAPAYPDGTEVTVWATLVDAEFRWDHWEGALSGTDTTNVFVILSNIVAQAVFVSSNANTYGVPESWLIGHGIPPTQQGAEMDNDEDGFLNWEEYYAGTVPTNGLSVLALTEMQRGDERFALVFLSVTGKTYRPQSTPSLTLPGGWANEAWSATHDGPLADSPVAGNGGSITVYVSTGGVSRCYRVLLEL